MRWKLLENQDVFLQLIANSTPFALFKHSTTCPVSAVVKKRLEMSWDKENSDIDIYYLDLLAHRDLSNYIANNLKVVHQSPQLMVIKNGKVIYHASHISINPAKVSISLKA